MNPCTGYCGPHTFICDLDDGHDGDHECNACPGALRRQRAQMIADRVAAHKQLRDLFPAPDED